MSLRGDAGVLAETIDGRLLRHPTFFVLAQLARLKCLRAVTVSNLAGITGMVALAGACDDRDDWLIANLTSQTVDLRRRGFIRVDARRLGIGMGCKAVLVPT